ncbi:hypothetical protein BROUX41_003316 [Berkeleyomyces rouxiae]|uniref:uncharacterized protein n=1 Tax=Berkeleyomyces rouxiae TaxID=2035830 RepID=UPI003B78A052
MSSPSTYYMDSMEAYLDLENADFSWMGATVIDDDDLMFGGKPLCAWYEEDRQRFSNPYEDEEHRGRERVRREYSPETSSSQQRSSHIASTSTSSSASCEPQDNGCPSVQH